MTFKIQKLLEQKRACTTRLTHFIESSISNRQNSQLVPHYDCSQSPKPVVLDALDVVCTPHRKFAASFLRLLLHQTAPEHNQHKTGYVIV